MTMERNWSKLDSNNNETIMTCCACVYVTRCGVQSKHQMPKKQNKGTKKNENFESYFFLSISFEWIIMIMIIL